MRGQDEGVQILLGALKLLITMETQAVLEKLSLPPWRTLLEVLLSGEL